MLQSGGADRGAKRKGLPSESDAELQKLDFLKPMSARTEAPASALDQFATFGNHVASELQQIQDPSSLRRLKRSILNLIYDAQDSEHQPPAPSLPHSTPNTKFLPPSSPAELQHNTPGQSTVCDLSRDSVTVPRTDLIKELVSKCLQARDVAYCPYSHFPVGAALLTAGGAIVTGCNVENASFGLTLCAERVAVQRAVVEGHRKFTAIAVTCDIEDSFVGPCGACRQVLMEFGSDWAVYLTKPDGSYRETSLRELLPLAFSPEHLAKK